MPQSSACEATDYERQSHIRERRPYRDGGRCRGDPCTCKVTSGQRSLGLLLELSESCRCLVLLHSHPLSFDRNTRVGALSITKRLTGTKRTIFGKEFMVRLNWTAVHAWHQQFAGKRVKSDRPGQPFSSPDVRSCFHRSPSEQAEASTSWAGLEWLCYRVHGSLVRQPDRTSRRSMSGAFRMASPARFFARVSAPFTLTEHMHRVRW